MLGEYLEYSGDEDFVRSLYDTFVKPAGDFMTRFFDEQTGLPHASYDLWEEKFLTSTYTAATVYQALLVAAEFAEKFEYPDDALKWRDAAERILANAKIFFDETKKAYRKGFLLQPDGSLELDNTVDVSSLYGVMMFGLHDSSAEHLHATISTIEDILLDQAPSGGSPRYEHDNYFESSPPYLGNPWFVTTLWLAQYYIRIHKTEKAEKYVDWAMKHAMPSGVMSEQVNPNDGSPLSVTPLVWSHAEFINTVLDISNSGERKGQA
jgi:GH15 family glucan-1,4-alpha-glucosidase